MSCETFHYDPSRLGFGDGAPRNLAWHKRLEVSLGSATFAAPLIYSHPVLVSRVPRITNYVYVASSNNTVRAYDENDLIAGNDTPIWKTTLGQATSGKGSNIGVPVGITSTPVLDPANHRLFVCSRRYMFGSISIASQHPVQHRIAFVMYALNMFDGSISQSAELVDATSSNRNFRFDASLQDQRGALNLVDGTVYATFAAFSGDDLGHYHGWFVGCEADELATQYFFSTTQTTLGGGCWGPGGAAARVDTSEFNGSLYIATGNAMWAESTGSKDYFNNLGSVSPAGEFQDYFLSVVRLQKVTNRLGLPPQRETRKLEVKDWFQPAQVDQRPDDFIKFGDEIRSGPMTLQELDDRDLDFGSSSCLVLPEIQGRRLIVISTKAFVFLLDSEDLGQSGPALYTEHVFKGFDAVPPNPDFNPAESHSAPAYLFAGGEHLVFLSGGGVEQLDNALSSLVCFRVDMKPTPALSRKWSAQVALTTACASPTVGVSTVGDFNQPEFHALVWVADIAANDFHGGGAFLQAYDALTGQLVFDSLTDRADQLVADLPHYAPITCSGASIYLGTADGFALFRATRNWALVNTHAAARIPPPTK